MRNNLSFHLCSALFEVIFARPRTGLLQPVALKGSLSHARDAGRRWLDSSFLPCLALEQSGWKVGISVIPAPE